jgi:hypothetical protein
MPHRPRMPPRAAPRAGPRRRAERYHNVPVLESTWHRLRDYKMVSATYDEVLNQLMDSVPLETVTEDILAEHKRRLKSKDWKDWREVRKQLGDE